MSSVKSFIAAVVPAVTVAATLSAVFVGSPARAADPAPIGPGELSRSFDYECATNVGGLDLGRQPATVTAAMTYPETASPGDVLPARDLDVSLALPDLLRETVSAIIRAKAFEGAARVALTTESAGRATTLDPIALTIARADVPEVTGPWTLKAEGTVPSIVVPGDARQAVWLGMPSTFTVSGTMIPRSEGESGIPASLTCSRSGDRTIGGILLEGATNPTPPTAWPTSTPPTTPTTPTPSVPTDPPTDPGPNPGNNITVGPGTLSRTVAYQCAVVAGGLDLGFQDFLLAAKASYPETAAPGEVLPRRELSVRWTASELMRQSIQQLMGARSAATSSATALSVTTAGRTSELAPTTLTFPRTPIPEALNAEWTIDGAGTIPAITAPSDATGALWLGLPANLRLDTVLTKADGSTLSMVATCAAGRDRLLGGIALAGQTDPEPPVLDPGTPPTRPTPPTTSTPPPSTPPTAYPTDPPAEPGSAAPVGPGELSRTLPHRCAGVADGLVLWTYDVPVTASATYPETAEPGDTLAARRVGLSLAFPEQLRQAVTELFETYESDGFLRSPDWSLTTGGRTTALANPDATFPLANVPQMVGSPWTLQGGGTLPAITVPGYATEALWIETPRNFSIVGRLYRADHTSVAWELNCTGPNDRRIGGIALLGGTPQPSPSMTMPTRPTTGPTTPTTPPTRPTMATTAPTVPTTAPTVPTTAPTTPATVGPTAQPTTAPTSGPVLLAPTLKIGTAALWRSAVFTVGVSAKGTVPTGTVTVRRGDKTVAKGKLFLGVTILTASNLPKGDQTFTITYSGDAKVAAKTVTKVVRIN